MLLLVSRSLAARMDARMEKLEKSNASLIAKLEQLERRLQELKEREAEPRTCLTRGEQMIHRFKVTQFAAALPVSGATIRGISGMKVKEGKRLGRNQESTQKKMFANLVGSEVFDHLTYVFAHVCREGTGPDLSVNDKHVLSAGLSRAMLLAPRPDCPAGGTRMVHHGKALVDCDPENIAILLNLCARVLNTAV